MLKKLLLGLLFLTMAVMSGQSAHAADANAVKAQLMTARENLVAMLDVGDKTPAATRIAAIGEATKSVDAAIEGAAEYAAFKEVWAAFKTTRDGELIPLITSGKIAEAKALSASVQSERMKKMVGILAELGAK